MLCHEDSLTLLIKPGLNSNLLLRHLVAHWEVVHYSALECVRDKYNIKSKELHKEN